MICSPAMPSGCWRAAACNVTEVHTIRVGVKTKIHDSLTRLSDSHLLCAGGE